MMPTPRPSAAHVFSVLGPLRYRAGGQWLPVRGALRRRLLALLLLRCNRTVPVADLLGELWDDRPPAAAAGQLETQVRRLGQLLAGSDRPGLASGAAPRLITNERGYQLAVDPASVDVSTFVRLATDGATELRAGEPAAAVDILRAALTLWHGPALLDVTGALVRSEAEILDAQRLATLQDCLEARLALAEHRRLVGELRALVARHPMHEGFAGQLMLALARCGQHGDALDVYRHLRARLVTAAGLEPDEPLRELQQAILAGGPARSRHQPVSGAASRPAAAAPPI